MKTLLTLCLLALVSTAALARDTPAAAPSFPAAQISDPELAAALEKFRRLQAPEILVAEVITLRAEERTLRARDKDLPAHFWETGDDSWSPAPVIEPPPNFPADRRPALVELEWDYRDLANNMKRHVRNKLYLPQDRERLLVLRQERLRDLTALLSPAELADYHLWTSPIANRMRAELWLFAPDETEFRHIHRLRTGFHEQFLEHSEFNVPLGARFNEYIEARKNLANAIRESIGEARFADYQRALDPGFERIYRALIDARADTSAAWRIHALQSLITEECDRLAKLRDQPRPFIRTRLIELADMVDAESARLGGDAAPHILKIVAHWTAPLREGHAVRFEPPSGMRTTLIAPDPAPAR